MTDLGEHLHLRVATDRMTADLMLKAPHPGVTPEALRAFLAARRIAHGLDDAALAAVAARPGAWLTVARGEAAPPAVEFKVSRAAPPDGPDAVLARLGVHAPVKTGDLIAVAADNAVTGHDIFGDPLPTASAPARPGRGIQADAAGREFRAAVDGRLLVDRDGRFSVERVLVIETEAPAETGPIDHAESVVVPGDLAGGRRIKAGGRILVAGGIGEAVLEAGEGILVLGPVHGNGRAVFQSPADIQLAKAVEAVIFSGSAVRVAESLLDCSVIAARAVIVEKGGIEGGSTTAPEIQCDYLGSELGARTVVEIGIAPRTRLVCSRLETEFGRLRQAAAQTRAALKPLKERRLTGEVLPGAEYMELDRLEDEDAAQSRRFMEIAADIVEMMSRDDSCVPGRLEAREVVHAGVVIASARTEKAIHHKHGGLQVTATLGKLGEIQGEPA